MLPSRTCFPAPEGKENPDNKAWIYPGPGLLMPSTGRVGTLRLLALRIMTGVEGGETPGVDRGKRRDAGTRGQRTTDV